MKKYDNAFELITDDKDKLADYKERSELMDEINDYIKNVTVTHFLVVIVNDLDDLKNGRLSKFTLGRLKRIKRQLNIK